MNIKKLRLMKIFEMMPILLLPKYPRKIPMGLIKNVMIQ